MKKQLVLGVLILSGFMLISGCDKDGPAERAGEQVDEAVQDGSNKVEDMVESAGESLEEAGDKIKQDTQ